MQEQQIKNNQTNKTMIKIYTTPVCPYCQMAKDFMKQYQIDFEEVDVTKNEQGLQEMVSKSGQLGVPVIDIDGKILVGFNRRILANLLGIETEL